MAITYAVNTTNTTNVIGAGFSTISGNFTNRRFFGAADPSGGTIIPVSNLQFVRVGLWGNADDDLTVYYKLRYAVSGTWRPTLTATEADFTSTMHIDCGDLLPSVGQYNYWDIPTADFDQTQVACFRVASEDENTYGTTKATSFTVNSANNSSHKPILIIQPKNAPARILLLRVGSGLSGVQQSYNGLTTDGTITQTRGSADAIPDIP